MTQVLMILLLVVMVAILAVLGAGMVGVARGGNPQRSNRLMRWRVILQGAALVIVALLLMTRR
jgi:threonine/homoserine/homoserine lactone efflux protein